MNIVTRFAPSPTGYLHIGNVRTALFNFLFARHAGGKMILRIEDTDFERSKKEYADAVMNDLKAVGITWDEGPFYQSERFSIYNDALNQLKKKELVYQCYCTAEELAARRKEALLMKRPPRYDNRCRTLTQAEIDKKKSEGVQPTIRFKVDEKDPILVEDLIRGKVHFNPDEIGDFVIMRTHPSKPGEFLPTFHMSVCVDDGLMKVTHVIRGEDHLSNSPRHVLLFKALDYEVPKFAHLSLIHGPGGEPLSKRLTAVRVRDFIDKTGYLAEALLNYLSLLGWSPKDNREVMTIPEIIQEFDPENATKHPAIFNEEKLDWINSEHLRKLEESDYVGRAIHFLKSLGDVTKDLFQNPAYLEKSLLLVRTDIKKFQDLPERLNFLPEPSREKLGNDEKAVLAEPQTPEVLDKAGKALSELTETGEALFDALTGYLKKNTTVKGKALFMPLRIAVTGHIHGPELKKVFGILDKKTIQNRIQIMLTFATK